MQRDYPLECYLWDGVVVRISLKDKVVGETVLPIRNITLPTFAGAELFQPPNMSQKCVLIGQNWSGRLNSMNFNGIERME